MTQSVWIKFYADGQLRDTVTFLEIIQRVDKQITELRKAGVGSGDRAIVRMPNSIQAVATYFALRNMNAIAVPLNPLEEKVRIDYILKNCDPKVIIGPAGRIEEIREARNTVYSQDAIDKIATIIYTSGTTGQPKGACLSWKNWEANAHALIQHHKLNSSTIVATPLPLFHCNAHGFAMYATFLAKSRLILFDKTPKNFLEIINKEGAHITSIVPAILHKLFHSDPMWRAHARFNYFLTAAAPLRADLLRLIMNQWSVEVVQGYGLTESTNFSCTLPIHLSKTLYKRVMFPQPSIGIALPGVDVKNLDDKENKSGEILIESKSNFLGYWGEPLRERRIVETGDIGYFKTFDGQNFYYLRCRIKELINRGGEKTYPLELEAEIRSLGLTEEFHIFSLPDEKLGEEIGLAALRAFDFSILKNIPAYRRPKRVYQVTNFYRTLTGKLQRTRLAEYCQSGAAKLLWRYEKASKNLSQ